MFGTEDPVQTPEAWLAKWSFRQTREGLGFGV